jgi:hypothetical protein
MSPDDAVSTAATCPKHLGTNPGRARVWRAHGVRSRLSHQTLLRIGFGRKPDQPNDTEVPAEKTFYGTCHDPLMTMTENPPGKNPDANEGITVNTNVN